jgi:hypothetical protein
MIFSIGAWLKSIENLLYLLRHFRTYFGGKKLHPLRNEQSLDDMSKK